MGQKNLVKFTSENKNEIYTPFDVVLFREGCDPWRFSYRQGDPFAAEMESHAAALIYEYKKDMQQLSAR